MSVSFTPESLFGSSSSLVVILDHKAAVVYSNAAFLRVFPYAGAGGIPEELVALAADCSRSSSGSAGPTTVQKFTAGGKNLSWSFNASVIQNGQAPGQVMLTGTDVSDVLSHEKIRNSFLVRMGHEIRTPINTLLGYTQLLKGLEGLSPVAQEYLSTILTNEHSLLHLINDLMELFKYESGQTELVNGPVSIREIIEDVVSSWKDQFAEKYLSLDIEYRGELGESCLTDSAKIKHIISNLVGNALRFTRKGGVRIIVSGGPLFTIDVEDTGIGIPAEEHSEVFEVFSRVDQKMETSGGIGIGLTVARIFARMLGGELALLRSDPGKGSSFRLTFKAEILENTKPTVQKIEDYAAVTGINKPCKVLLVDDVDINLAMLEIFLAPAGFNVSVANDGNEAVERFKSFHPDIVFMDLIMPGKDGFDATREIKNIDASIPVVALTASISDSVREQAMSAGVNGFMNKPFIPERFFEIIAEHTGVQYTFA